MAVVSGDPTRPVRSSSAPNSRPITPSRRTAIGDEVVRVLSVGTLTYGNGDKVNPGNFGIADQGYHVTMQAGMNHWVTTTDPLEIQVSGNGRSRSPTPIRRRSAGRSGTERSVRRLTAGRVERRYG